jgi:hypothetical protein
MNEEGNRVAARSCLFRQLTATSSTAASAVFIVIVLIVA